MSGSVDAAGWYNSTNRELENASLPSVISEDIHNVEHYYETHGADAPIANILYISSSFRGNTLFVRASNMPHTETVINKKFTAFAQKVAESMVATHGYGALLPSMYIGGALEIQFQEKEEWKRVTLNIEAQRKQCSEQRCLDIFPSNASDLAIGECPLVSNKHVWDESILHEFESQKICTIELHKNPTFKGHCDIRDKQTFCQFLESVQFQFEEILNKKVRVTGIFVEADRSEMYTLPFNFWKTLYNPNAAVWPYPYSPHCTTQLEACRSFDVDYTDTSIHCRTTIRSVDRFFAITEKKEIQPVDPIPGFTPRFRVWCGRATKDAHAYALNITGDPKHPAHLQILEDFANGLVVNLNGFRMNLLPLRGEIPRSERRPFLTRTRMGVDVLDQETKRKFIDARPRKDASMLRTIHSGKFKNILKFVATRIAALVKSCEDPAEEDGREADRLLHAITVKPTARKTSTRKSAIAGHNFEASCADLLRNEFPDCVVTEGDVRIRREFLGTDNKQYTGIDILMTVPDMMHILIQCKHKDRIQPEDYDSFLRTFQYAVDTHAGTNLHGLFVIHKEKLQWNDSLRKLVSTPGINLVFVNDTDMNELASVVQNTINYCDASMTRPN